jgi:hypothetical protein
MPFSALSHPKLFNSGTISVARKGLQKAFPAPLSLDFLDLDAPDRFIAPKRNQIIGAMAASGSEDGVAV